MKNLYKLKRLINKLIPVNIKNKGKNNVVNISPSAYTRKVKIKIYGNNNTIEIKDDAYLHDARIIIGFPDCPINNCIIRIGEKTSINSMDVQLGESSSSLIIGKDCMFSFNIEISLTDTHALLDSDGNVTNIGKNITIGNHVWFGKGVKILKNTSVADNCVVAQYSIITKKFDVKNAVIAGSPAKVVKENINWSRLRPQYMIDRKSKL